MSLDPHLVDLAHRTVHSYTELLLFREWLLFAAEWQHRVIPSGRLPDLVEWFERYATMTGLDMTHPAILNASWGAVGALPMNMGDARN